MKKQAAIAIAGYLFFAQTHVVFSKDLKCPDDERLKVVRNETGGKKKTTGTYSYIIDEDSKEAKIQVYLHQTSFILNGMYSLWTRDSDGQPCYVRGIFKIKEVENLFLDGPFMYVFLKKKNVASKDLEIIAVKVGKVLEHHLGATPAKPFTMSPISSSPISSFSSSSFFIP